MTPTARTTALGLALLALAAPAPAGDAERTYRRITLDNGLRVVLASDPDVNVSAASMAVGVGANADPADAQGLAHFLEHMLFLANEKYPELNSYSNFLQARGGGSNAYTSQDHTNYHFQVNHDALPEALDRFAQFFISPTLDYAYAERERSAVNSEHQKNTMDDTWRLMQLQREQLREDHPGGQFSTGNAETLADAEEETLRGFFEAYYKPPNMALAVLADRSLDDLERIVRERFAGIPAGEPEPWSMSPDIMEESDGLRLLRVVPVKDVRELRLFFEVPPQHPHALTKIESLVGLTMGDEGKGSLLSLLKERGLATFLSAGVGGTRFYSQCTVRIGLTPQGLERWQEVLRLAFAYTKMLQGAGFPRHVWEEMRTLAELEDEYGAKPEGTQGAMALANEVLELGLEAAGRVGTTFEEPDPAAYQALVDALRPEKSVVFVVAPGLETDQTEPYYGTHYSATVEEGELLESLRAVEVPEALHLPRPNPFVPDDTRLHPEQPVLIQQDDRVTLYYAQDAEFGRPKVKLQLHVLTPAVEPTPEAMALTSLYTALIQEQLNEYAYPAMMAGLSYSLMATDQGIVLSLSGYSDSAFELLEIVGRSLRGELDADAFARVKQRSIEELKNFPLGQAYMVVTELGRELSVRRNVTPAERLPIVEAATLEQLRGHVEVLLAGTHVEALCAGNLTPDQARTAVAGFQEALASEPYDPERAYEPHVLLLEEPGAVVLKRVGRTDQNCVRLDYQVGRSDVDTRMAAELLGVFVRNPFFTEMRTRQELGYIVFAGAYNRENVQNLVFLIQSGTHDPDDLRGRAEAFIAQLPEAFAQLPAGQFEAIRQSLIEDRRKEPKTIAEEADRFYLGAFEKDADFRWIEKEIAAIEALEQEQVAELFRRTVAPDSRRVVVYELAAAGHEYEEPGTVEDLPAFREAHTYIQEEPGR